MAQTSFTKYINVLEDVLRSLDKKNNDGQQESDRTPLLAKRRDVESSLTDSESSDSEFDDILRDPKPRKKSHHVEKKVTNTGTLMHLLKANVGVGLLAMPKAMSNFGLLAGSIGIFILGSIYIYCIHLLLALTRGIAKRVTFDRSEAQLIKVLRELIKRLNREERKNKRIKRMKDVAGGCMSITEEADRKWKVKYASDIEIGESSKSNKDNSTKKSENWKKKYVEDFELGESSASNKNNFKNMKEKSVKVVETGVDIEEEQEFEDAKTDIDSDPEEKFVKIVRKGIDIDEEQESEDPKNENIPEMKEKTKKKVEKRGNISKTEATVEKNDKSPNNKVASKKKVAQEGKENQEIKNAHTKSDKISGKKISSKKKVAQKGIEIEEVEDTDTENDTIPDMKVKSKKKVAQKGEEIEEIEDTDTESDNIPDKKVKSKKKVAQKEREIEEIEETDTESDSIPEKKVKSKKKVAQKGREIEEIEDTDAKSDNIPDKKVKSKIKVAQKGREIEEIEDTDTESDNIPDNAQSNQSVVKKGEEEVKFSIELDEAILRSLDFPKLVELSFHYGQNDTKWMMKFFKFYTKALLILTHSGCCCVCFLYVAESLSEVATTGKYFTHGSSFRLVAYALPIMICLSFIPDRHELTGVTLIAFLLQICGVIMMLYFFIIGDHSENMHPFIAPFDTWSLYFGIVFYAFEGTGVTLHLQSHMEKQEDFIGKRGILNISMFILIPLCVTFGALGYWKFGNDVKTSVTFNLPEGRLTDLVQIMTALGILLTYPLHFSFVLTPLKKLFIRDEYTDNVKQFLDLVLRTMFVTFTFVVAALVPYLELQLSVLGATTSCFLILFLPPFMSINTYGQLPGIKFSNCRLLFHLLIMFIGMAGSLLGAYTTIKNLPLYYPNATIFG